LVPPSTLLVPPSTLLVPPGTLLIPISTLLIPSSRLLVPPSTLLVPPLQSFGQFLRTLPEFGLLARQLLELTLHRFGRQLVAAGGELLLPPQRCVLAARQLANGVEFAVACLALLGRRRRFVVGLLLTRQFFV